MSLYEITSTLQATVRRRKNAPREATPEEMNDTREWLARMTANDPSVRLH